MTTTQMVLVLLIIFATSVVQAVAGFGFALLAVPLMVVVIDLQSAVIISSFVGTLSNMLQSWQLRRNINRNMTRRFVLATAVGSPVGLLLFVYANQSALKIVLGLSILFGVFVLSRGLELQHVSSWLDWIMGILSGVLLMATSTNGPPLVFVLQARRIDPATFRATLNMVFLVSATFGLVMFGLAGEILRSDVNVAAFAIPAMVIGVSTGVVIRKYVQQELFKKIVLFLLSIGGLSSLFGGIFG
ncbi:MAG: sulfite exporter TauE/SafE family protein [Ilumatobacteraceae bacterium]|nr:sulfite exporter TauE/SafE family protein [Ilumatobacteraceae bacterium]